MTSDVLVFADEVADLTPATGPVPWPWVVLVVDDDPEVHQVTRLVLHRFRYRGRGMRVLSAYSAAEARAMLASEPEVAVVLLDVVMETDRAGLDLVHHIRRDLGNRLVRIVLRTGQPGEAPPEAVIVDYDINDYRPKTELTASRLFTTLVAALRAFEDITILETSRRRLEAVAEAADQLFHLRSIDAFARGVLEHVAAVLETGGDGLVCLRHSGGDIQVAAAAGWLAPLAGAVLEYGAADPQVVEAVAATLNRRSAIDGPACSTLYVATPEGDEMVVCLGTGRPLSDLERPLVRLFCRKLSVGLANVRLYETLEQRVEQRTRELEQANRELVRLATTDPLTGAANRRHFLDLAGREVERSRRYGQPLSLMMIDLDYFKHVNDEYGHAIGDEVLRRFAAAAGQCLRACDVLGRLGGEEFAVLLPETGRTAAVQAAERLRRAVAALEVPLPYGGAVRVTASIGVAELEGSQDCIEPSLHCADLALYAAKAGGRNRVIAAWEMAG